VTSAALIELSLTASAAFAGLVILAHILKPEIDARWRMLSELSIGRWGGVMNAAFIAWSASNVALAFALWSLVPVWATLALILVSLGPLGAAFATADPITTPRDQMSVRARWHAVFGLLFILGLPVVTILFAVATFGDGRLWPWTIAMASVVWASLAGFMVATIGWGREGRQPGPDMPIGIPNRIFSAAFVAWTVVIALVARPFLA
jgi:hypothetical protein